MATTTTITVPTAGEGRVIQHYTDAPTQTTIMAHVGKQNFYAAVGYLSSWNLSFPRVAIYYNAKDMEITATYYREDGEMGYCIGAVWNEHTQQFGFHS